jgi:hypothetical protein
MLLQKFKIKRVNSLRLSENNSSEEDQSEKKTFLHFLVVENSKEILGPQQNKFRQRDAQKREK